MSRFTALCLAASFLAVQPLGAQSPSSSLSQPARPEIAKYVQAYSGGQNLKLWILRVGPRQAQEYLVQVTGIDHDWDGKIQKTQARTVQDEQRFTVTTADGQQLLVLNLANDSGYLHLPGESHARSVGYDKYLAEEANAEHFLSAYLQQQAEVK